MDVVKHKIWGMGEVIKRDGKYVTIRFLKDNSEKRFVIPESFQTGVLDAQGDFKKEIENAILLKKSEKPSAKTLSPVSDSYDVNMVDSSFNETNYSHELSPIDKKIIELLYELCPDFQEYHFTKNDLYKGSLFGGTNVYFKRGQNNTVGLVSTQRNIKLYNLDRYAYNFKTEAVGKGTVEHGWTGDILLTLLNDLLRYK